nr:heparinase II/III family protein [Micromonospora tarapacensis]
MLIVRVLLGGAPSAVHRDLRTASSHLARLGVFDGDVPQYGDWDEGRVLASSGDALDVAGSTALGLALCGARLPTQWYARFDELAWYASPPPPQSAPGGLEPVTYTRSAPATTSGGIALVERGPWRVWFKVDGGPSHGHADLTSVWIKHGGQWLVADPGTGTYNGPLEVRNGLRTSAAHSVRRPDGRDQLVPHRAFRWRNTAHGYLGAPLVLPDHTIVFGWHDAYTGGERPVRVGRAVVVADRYVAVVEFADRPAAADSWSLTIPLHPDTMVEADTLVNGECKLGLFGLDGYTATRGRAAPFAGWHSRTYGRWEPTTWITVESRADTAVWGLGTVPGPPPGPDALDGLRFEVAWTRAGAELAVTDLASTEVHRVRASR